MTANVARPDRRKLGCCIVLVAGALALGGCSPGEVELQGKIFDVMGVNSNGPKETPKVARRSGLVTPPSLERLPEPGSAQGPANDELAGIADPDRIVREAPAALAARQKAYCDKHYEPAVAAGDATAESIEGPAGPCRRSVLTAIENWNKQE